MERRILVGTDGSDDAHHAVEWCAAYARDSDIEIVVCHVVTKFAEWMMSAGQMDFQAVEKEHFRLLGGLWTEPLRTAGVPYRVVQASGDPVRTLLAIADDEDVELIVIGKAGHGAIGELLLGGTAAKFAHRTTRPLLIVPRPDTKQKPEKPGPERYVPLPG
jgi:nucleotide-binding universal stress UspA family protein